MKRNTITIILLLLFLTAMSAGVGAAAPEKAAVLITGIKVADNTVIIQGDRPFTYKVFKPSDPYRVAIEIPGADISSFKEVIRSAAAGITEVTPLQIDFPAKMAHLEVLLQSPFGVDTAYTDNALTLTVKKEPAESAAAVKASPEAKQQASAGGTAEITDIGFDSRERELKIVIAANAPLNPSVFTLKDTIVIDIPDASLKASVPVRTIPPVKAIRAGKHMEKTRLVVDLAEPREFDVVTDNNKIIIALQSSEVVTRAAAKMEMAQQAAKEPAMREPETRAVERPEAIEPESIATEGRYNGRRISLDFQDSDIIPIFRLLSDISGYNVVVSPEVRGRLTMKLINVPWDQALDLILKTFSLGKSVEGNIIRIAPLSVFAKEQEEKAKVREAALKAEPLMTKVYPINYAKVSVVKEGIERSKMISPRGSISVDERTSSLVVKDVESAFSQIEGLLATLDKPIPQVLVEARIVEVSTNDSRDLGIQWGGFISATNALALATGFPTFTTGAFTGAPFVVDLPSGATGTGSGSGFSVGIMNPAKTLGLDLQLTALEKIGSTKIISSPKVVTTDNVPARISQGQDIPYPQATAEGTVSAAFKTVAVSIEVTPHITPANTINMNILVTKEDFLEFVQIGLGQAPRTTKIEGRTAVLVQNGETVVIGGVYKKTARDSASGVPWLMNLPVLGWLFKTNSVGEETSELLIFITPRIMEKP